MSCKPILLSFDKLKPLLNRLTFSIGLKFIVHASHDCIQHAIAPRHRHDIEFLSIRALYLKSELVCTIDVKLTRTHFITLLDRFEATQYTLLILSTLAPLTITLERTDSV